jgi:hypothetical protein
MKSPISGFKPEVFDATAPGELYLALPTSRSYRNNMPPGLSGHVRQLQRANRGISRWIVLALFGGVVVAFALVRLAIL